jgi:acetyl esterase/lipase
VAPAHTRPRPRALTALAAALWLSGLALLPSPAQAAGAREPVPPLRDPVVLAALLGTQYRVEPDIVYTAVQTARGLWEGKLDLYLPHAAQGPVPTVVSFHGGGWVTGDKAEETLDLLPYLAMGFAVVNVDYRLARVSPAPGAVEDSRCALRWVMRHAAQYGFDTSKLVTTGNSAGAHLALLAALAPASAGFDGRCPGDEELRVAAVVNLFGVIDVADLLAPAHERDFAIGWLGERPDRGELARRVSPLSYVADARHPPAVLTVHGDADPVVPYEQAVRLHEALTRAGTPNRLYTVRGGGHGDFRGNDVLRFTRVVHEFLVQRGIAERR